MAYGGVDEDTWNIIKPDVTKLNRAMTTCLSLAAGGIITVMFLLSYVLTGLESSRYVYLIGTVLSYSIFFLSHVLGKKRPVCVTLAVYMALQTYLTYGLFIGAFTRTSQQTVTFMVMLVLMALIFVDRPANISGVLFLNVITFIAIIPHTKPASIIPVDMIDAIIFGLLGAIVGTIIICVKVDSFVSRYKLKLFSETDQLTGLHNRNCYEWQLENYGRKYRESIACIYMDANGLHELNNTQGHQAGDLMLIAISQAIQAEFTAENAYRIGGDEFVVFVKDLPESDLMDKLQIIQASLAKHKYHIAVGYDYYTRASANAFDLGALIKNAETRMYDNKHTYYETTGISRAAHNY